LALLAFQRAVIPTATEHDSWRISPTQRDRKMQRSVDPAIYRERNLIERFFNTLKHFGHIATRYDKTARRYLPAVLIAATRLWMRFEPHYLTLLWQIKLLWRPE
jgi:transposase